MTTLRSSLPLRLRHLLTGEGAVGPSLKLESEPPPKVKAFIDKVIKITLSDIAIPLSGFRWEYNKGNFHHWRPLFLHFDTYFKTYISCRKDLLLSDITSEDFPKNAVLQILRVMQIILENCHNKSSFSGLEHFKLLLACTDPEIVIATLETLAALVKINPSKLHVSGKLIGCGSVNSCLLSLAQGWGSKEEGLGLYSCVMANERIQDEGLSLFPSDVKNECDKSHYRLGSTLYFEFHGVNSQNAVGSSGNMPSNLRVIHIPDLHLHKGDDLLFLKQCIEQYDVPPEHRFSLLTRIRYARAFQSPKTSRLHSRICLLAFIVLVQSSDAHDELVSFFSNEPEYTNELIRIVRSEESIPGSIKTLAMLALSAQLAAYSSSHERARILSGSSIISAGGNRMILLNALQKAVLALNSSSDPSSLSFVEALLQFYLLHVISSSSSGSAIRGSGMVPTLLPLLQDVNSAHMHLVCFAVKTLQKLMDYSNAAVTLFKDLGGVELLAQRLQTEVHRVIGLVSADGNSMVIGGQSRYDEDRLYSQKRLIKALLKALGSATYAPANSSRSQNTHDNSLPASLSLIFGNVEKFGGDIYFSAVTVMSEIIHKDPTCFSSLHELGLPDAFLSSVVAGILPSSKAITCVPSGLGAICLNAKGLEAVKETMALHFLVDIFTSRKYVVAMNEGVVPLANAVEELLRHVSSLRSTGVDIIIEIIDKLASMGDDNGGLGSSGKVDGGTAMETDSEDREQEGHGCRVSAMDVAADGISNERFVQLCIFHVMVLVHRTMENSETCRFFVEKKGIEALMKLLLRPSIAQSSEGMSIALHSTVVFKGFTQHHSAVLARAFCSSLRDRLKKTLDGFNSVTGSFLLDPRITPDKGIFSLLFVVEFLLFLAASKDNRWVTALLTEFGNGSKDVLEDIGRVHRELLWQIALLEDAKLDVGDKVSSSGSSEDPQKSDTNAGETEEQRFNSFRQFLDPLLRRRMSGWSVESQFFDLISLYRDLGRAAGVQPRLVMDGPSNMRLGSSQHLHGSGSTDASGAVSSMEADAQRNYYSSCSDMMRSLAFHISYLFLELGKVMLLPSRRRDDTMNVSPASKSVVSTFASIILDHLNFGGHTDSSGSEASISSKCRYFGKVIDFIDSILLDRPDSCNPILLNCFYGHEVVQAVLTTFEATSQLLFAVNRAPASPMDTDDGSSLQGEREETDYSWIYGPLASYGTLMDHLVTSSFIISPFTKHLLGQPLTNGNVPFPRDAEAFVKVLQSKVLKTVLPIWTHPQFTECSYEFITTVISIMRHVYCGVEVKDASNNSGARMVGPPPNESTISMIVEMGFSRARAEEALRQVGTNSVEMAMEWLFSHPEEAQEDDELARALAMSLGNSGMSQKDDVDGNASNLDQAEEIVQLPPVDDLLVTCIRLLQMKEPLAFPVRDLLVMLCSQNDGQCRSKVISFVIEHVKLCSSILDSGNSGMLSALFHVLALVLHEDTAAREAASQHGLIKIASDLLSQWDPSMHDGQKVQVPKWVTTAFLAIDRLLQVDPKLNSDISEQLQKDDVSSQQASVTIDEDKQNNLQSTFGLTSRYIDEHDQKRLIEVACRCIKNQLPSETMHVVLQLCATLTRTHSVAIAFLDAGGLPSLLSLPTSSLFSGFDNVAATIVRHILEDPHTLQQAMESEIRHSLVSATNRHSNGRLTPRNFLLNLASVISRDPVVFMRAAQSVCQVEMVGERPYVILLKDREKDKSKEKEKASEKDKQQLVDGKTSLGDLNSMAPGNTQGKLPDSSTKSAKVHRKSPQSFVSVIELLLDSVITFVPSQRDDGVVDGPSIADMEIDGAANKGKGKAIATVSEECETNNQETSASLAKTVFIMKLLTEILLTYSSSVHILLRRDAEVSSSRGPPQRGASGNYSGGIFHHILQKFLPYSGNHKKEKKVDGDWRQKLATRASQFLVASCVRSAEARRRVFTDISHVLNDFVDSSNGFRPPDGSIHAFIDLLNDVLAARSPTGAYISAEASATFLDVGLVLSLTRTLQVLDLDHADSPKVVTGLVKALEAVTKEHVISADGKGENTNKPPEQSQPGRTDNGGDRFQSLETNSQPDRSEAVIDQIESFTTVQASGSSESIRDDMEHDRDMDGGFAPGADDDFMNENSEEAGGIENGMDSVGIRFEFSHNVQDNIGDEDDDEEISGDDGDEGDEDEDEDDEEHNDLEEDEVHHMSHGDTDQDDHEIDEDEFDEDVLEEEDEEDEDDDEGVILRLEEGINGINVFDHIEVFGRENSFPNDTLHVMPVEVFGSRRQGRTTSIYNLLGRSADHGAPSQHPLLLEPPSALHPAPPRQSEGSADMVFSDRNLDNSSSRLDTIFRSLRNGRHGHRFNMWVDDSQQRSGSSATAIPQGLEELLVSQLRQPTPDKPLDQNTTLAEPQGEGEASHLEESETGMKTDAPVETVVNNGSISTRPSGSTGVDGIGNSDGTPIENDLHGREESSAHTQAVDMQCERNDAVVRDVEAVSQESSGSGATLGESLRSLEVEIGSADGHDDGGERQTSTDRLPLGDLQPTRVRRTNVLLGNANPVSSRDASLQSVIEVSENPDQGADQSGPADEQQINREADSGSIDPAFLDALPEDLRAEVLSAQQGQAAQPSNDQPQSAGDIDPEFLAALPPDIRAEVLAQQQAQRLHQSQELEGQPVEMDAVSIIATFPSDLREEVLLTSSDAILANLTPALVAEANMLRERFAHRYHSRTLFGMYPRSRRGESSRRGEVVGASLDRIGGGIASRRSMGGKPLEADGAPLVDTEALKAMIRLLRVVQPLYKGQLQRLLLNLCAHHATRTTLVQILMDMLMLDMRRTVNHLSSAAEPSYRLYACQSHVMYSRPQYLDGVPPLVSRRILETLTYLARNHPSVAKLLLQLELPQTPVNEPESPDQARGKAVMIVDDDIESKQHQKGDFSIVLLLSLLNQPLYLRSIAHLEQLLNLLDVVIDNAENNSSSSNKSGESPVEQTSGPQMQDAELNVTGGSFSVGDVKASNTDECLKLSGSGTSNECDTRALLFSLPREELRLLCSLLAREGLSDNAYVLVAEVLRKLVAIAPTHCHLFITELADSVRQLSRFAMDELHVFGEAEKALLSTTSTSGTAILRVLQALSSLISSLLEKEKDQQTPSKREQNDPLSQVGEINAALEPLWLELSTCIGKIESYSDSVSDQSASSRTVTSTTAGVLPPLPAGTQNILPYVESFFVTCEKLHAAQSGAGHDFSIAVTSDVEDATSAAQQKTSGSLAKVDEKHVAFVKFSDKHRKLLNAFIRQNPGLLEKSFSLMLKVPRFIDFDNKRAHFRSKIKHQHDHHHSPLRISVRRAYILEDSYNQLRMRSTQDLKGRLTVHFQGEEGIDAGGLTREWYQLLSRVIFDKGALLFTTVGNESTFQPNPNSVYQTEHLSYFKFVGRVVGKALFDSQLLDVHFTRSFYKHILGVKVTYHDIEAIDPGYFKNLKWMLENDISDVLDLTFSIDADEEKLILYERAEVTDYELIPGGRNIRVTEENKHEYVGLVAEHRLTTAIRPQINAFLEGFSELIPRDLISIFNDKELELLISGLPDIDLDDLRANTEYSGYSAASPVIQWFWEVVQGFSKEDKARLLQFVTGTSKVPLEGFSALQGISGSQRFQIHKAYGSPDHLPSAHTCFNQLDLPEYPSKHHLEERLLLAIHEANEGFGFG
ncbi:E3 ubiquitin-protein ligase UPL2-like [Macadamia integrifolia]|uniref:E3 ubiquitin-protein ligase UPL2-like n=1 Tax=Macadamia integrifolia TaxID=60698 RepID=UPI001C4E4722|nr:E3 ubiquitin-protein ligase UPL2-like [Macadamia integrifolia]XP_042508613.1 E3 ubiquitin-protein ligase UPL2-like [Macadamia integrifolia]